MDKQPLLAAGTLDTIPTGRGLLPGAPNEAFHSLAEAFAAFLDMPALNEHLRRMIELLEAIHRPLDMKPLPSGVRPDIGRIMAALALSPTLAELKGSADVVDFRDLNEVEVAYVERVSLKTVQRWRTQGNGPEYRCEAGIFYPVLWLWEWRQRGKQRMTAQKKTRGRRD